MDIVRKICTGGKKGHLYVLYRPINIVVAVQEQIYIDGRSSVAASIYSSMAVFLAFLLAPRAVHLSVVPLFNKGISKGFLIGSVLFRARCTISYGCDA